MSLKVEGLTVTTGRGDTIVEDVSFEVPSGQLLGVVGESGCGKTTIGRALLGYARRGAKIVGGAVWVDDVDVLQLSPRDLVKARGALVSYIPQDPSAALNPALRIGTQLDETLAAHDDERGPKERRAVVEESLAAVGLEDPAYLRRFPHELSGGQQQRAAIAMAFLCQPKVVVLDEPTTALDVTTQARILKMVRELTTANDVTGVYISHDLAVVRDLAKKIVVLYGGRVAETGAASDVFATPSHPYTEVLLRAIPDIGERKRLPIITGHAPHPGERHGGCAFAPRCAMVQTVCGTRPLGSEIAHGHISYCHRAAEVVVHEQEPLAERGSAIGEAPVLEVQNVTIGYGDRDVLHNVSLRLQQGECLALVGESGSGKTTLSRSIAGLLVPRSGTISISGTVVAPHVRDRSSNVRRTLQYIFQSPYNSLNPRHSIGDILLGPIRLFFPSSSADATQRAIDALRRVALPSSVMDKFPDHLSGGERQRVAIARALVCEPKILVCDEITSALDVSVQASIVDLLYRLRNDEGLSLLFVTHNLALVRSIADRVVVLKDGQMVEVGPTDDVLTRPQAPYTQTLLLDTPKLSVAGVTSL